MSSQCSMNSCDCISPVHPKIHPTAYIDLTAKIIGNVYIGANVYIGPNVVIRADEKNDDDQIMPVVIGDNTNIQEGVVIHSHAGHSVEIGKDCCLTHGALIHGPCSIADDCFIGFRSIVYMSELESGAFVHAGCVIQNVKLAREALVPAGTAVTEQNQANKLGIVSLHEIDMFKNIVRVNRDHIKGYSRL